MVRFFAAPSDVSGGLIKLNSEDAAHIRSLRLRPDELFIVCDGEGTDYVCRLGERTGDPVAEIVEPRPSSGEPSVTCSVFIAFMKGERLDYAVQKSVELGAREITLYASERCIAVPGDLSKKTARLQRIALETAKQCGRGIVPGIFTVRSFREAVVQAADAGLPLFFYECEENLHLKAALERRDSIETVSIFTGPEGGFEPQEAEFAKSSGMVTVSLGPRILRCETAPAAALSAIMFHTGNF